jgi:thioredoxin 1
MAAQHFTDAKFDEEVTKSDIPVLIDFFATWCGPCQQLAPIIEELAGEYEGKVKIGKLDVDENNETAGKFQVMSIPTLVFMKGGEVVDKTTGFMSKEDLKEKLDAML